ncbi:MAG: N-acetylmuramoyl-L-alanine amidase family protein [Blautia massiliensis (ex Durand et al. 2017)]
MAKARIVHYEQPVRRAPEPATYVSWARRRRRRRARRLLFALAALVLASAAAYVVWYNHPARAAGDGRIVVAIDPGHGGVNPSIGAEDYGSEANGLRESEVTLATAQALYDLLEADGRFAPMLTADGTAYRKPSERGAAARDAGAEFLLSIHLNCDGSSETSGFECYAVPPDHLATNAESLRFGTLAAQAFGDLGLRLRGANGVRYLYYDGNNQKQIYESTDSTPRSDPTFTVLEACGCPAVLCEEGFISSPSDMDLLAGDEGCAAAAELYYQCLCEYFGLEAENR